ncbi:MAG: prephenate dehydrogenase/arogenate dehydrogenase family protein [Myxococcaceae bacterium]
MTSSHSIALLGYGRFGCALHSLVRRAGGTLRAYDPYQPPPTDVRVETLPDLLKGATEIVLAVPFGHLEESLQALTPRLTDAGPLVLDVCSVKVQPVALMAARFAAHLAWIGTHPLFGPTTLALGEKPLRAVICPRPEQPESTARARAFYEWLGCEVLEQSADAHDRVMAESHLAACFVAEGLLGAGFVTEQPFVTPSFRALVRVMDGVKGEADHLRAAVHHGNPYGAAARKRLLGALQKVDRGFADPQGESLSVLRTEIDAVDRELIALLTQRSALAQRVGELKVQQGLAVYDPTREESLFKSRRAWAEESGLDANAVEEIFRAVVKFSRDLQHVHRKRGEST